MATALEVAGRYRADLAALGDQAALLLARLWQQIDPADPVGTWTPLLAQAVGAFSAAQLVAASMADAYVTEVLAAQGVTRPPTARVAPDAFAGTGAAGAELAPLLRIPAQRTAYALQRGAPTATSLDLGRSLLAMYARTETADAGRTAAASAGVAHRVGGYVRALRAPSCARCAILAGRWYRYSAGFDRHPHCFPAGVVVSGPAVQGATRRWYEGELVRLVTASGQDLALTGNHPVLTRRGWVPAHLLQEGDEVVRSPRPESSRAVEVPDQHQMPARIEDVWGALRVLGLRQVPVRPEHFHGDGQSGEVDVVRADGSLADGVDTALLEQIVQELLTLAVELCFRLEHEGSAVFRDGRHAAEAARLVRRAGLLLPLGGRHLLAADLPGGTGTATLDAVGSEHACDDLAADVVLPGEAVLAGTSRIGGHDGGIRDGLPSARWDAPAGPMTEENRAGYAGRGSDLLQRLTGTVEVERLVDVARVQWSGHVYSLTSAEGWHSANSLIVSNCDCVNVPAENDIGAELVTDTLAAVRAGNVNGLTRAERQAIDLGADPSQVINARSGMTTAADGRRYTTAGTTRRGVAGARILARDMARTAVAEPGLTYRNFTVSRTEVARFEAQYGPLLARGRTFTQTTTRGDRTSAYRFTRTGRPSVEDILATSTSPDDAVRVLTNFGYLL